MRIVGFDISRSMAEIAYLENGTLHAGGRTGLRRDELERFAEKLRATDHVVLEATGNTAAIVNVLRRHVASVAIANPLQVRLIAEARVKTDKIDAAVLAQLYASAVATSRKLSVIVWYVLTRGEQFAWDRPALTAHKLRALDRRPECRRNMVRAKVRLPPTA